MLVVAITAYEVLCVHVLVVMWVWVLSVVLMLLVINTCIVVMIIDHHHVIGILCVWLFVLELKLFQQFGKVYKCGFNVMD